MEFRVLGPVEVVADGRRLAVASGRQLALLAYLLIHAGRVVSADRVLDALWGEEPPESGSKAVAFHISRLRDALEPGRARGTTDGLIVTEPAGYVLRAPSGSIDAAQFEGLAAEGRALLAEDPAEARTKLIEALALWRGDPYTELADESFAQPEIRRLGELRRRALEDRLEADLSLGDRDVVEELEALVAEEPFDERARAQLMVALYRAGRQAQALRAYAQGRQLLADELGIDPGAELQQLEDWILRQDPRLDEPARRRSLRNPYKGLRAFGEEDSQDYFGREALVERLVQRLSEVARVGRLLAVVGPSGSGKSSAVRAGLLPAVRSGALAGSQRWRVAVMVPGSRPFRELVASLQDVLPEVRPDLAERLEHGGDLAGALANVVPNGERLLLVIDQLEELYVLAEDEGERTRFGDAIVGALADPDGRLLVVATLRADYFARPLVLPGLGELVRAGTEVVIPLTRDELERAITRPAAAVGVQLEPGLAAEVIADVARQPGELPLLEYALTELFERSDGRRLTLEGYAAVGGVLGALGRRADDVYSTLDEEERGLARQVFLRLVASGETGEPVARRVPRAELLTLATSGRRLDAVLDAFGRRRLLSFDRDAVSGAATIQVAHEALLVRWPRLAVWIAQASEGLWTRRRLADEAADWIGAGRDPGFLLTGSRLDLFASWAASTDLALDAPERDLLDSSLAERRRQLDEALAAATHRRALDHRSATRLRALAAVVVAAVLVALSLSVIVYGQGGVQQEQEDVALARELAAASIGVLRTDARLSLSLAAYAADATAARGYVVEEAFDALNWALQASHVAYPTRDAPAAVRTGPSGAHGVLLVAPERLVALAVAAAGRGLTPAECRTYLHRATCTPPVSPAAGSALAVHTAAGDVGVELLASGSLAGTSVDLVSQLPLDLSPFLGPVRAAGIEVRWTSGAGSGGGLDARIAAGDVPDVAILERPALVPELAKGGLLVDMTPFVDGSRLAREAGTYLVDLGIVGADGSWPAATGRLYGAPFATEVESLVWYPRASFEAAGYTVPTTLAGLDSLTARMIADGHRPWCLGVSESGGAGAVDLVEELVLRMSGRLGYDRWVGYRISSQDTQVAYAFDAFGRLAFTPGSVLGGAAAAVRTPSEIAGWPMFVDPPGCWLHLAGGTDRLTRPADPTATLEAFPFPPGPDGDRRDIRGRSFEIVMFHDRPEVRRLVEGLLGGDVATSAAGALVAAGLWPTTSSTLDPIGEASRAEGELLKSALAADTFRVSARDLMPTPVADALDRGVVTYLSWKENSLVSVLEAIDAAWKVGR